MNGLSVYKTYEDLNGQELRASALLMAERLEKNAKGFIQLCMEREANLCYEKAKKIRENLEKAI